MHARASRFAPALLIVLSIAASACEDSNAVLQTGPTGLAPFQARLVSVEPATITPEFLPSRFCRTLPAFRTRLNLFVHADRDLFLRQVRFEFRDRSGGRSLPTPIPASPAIPIPGTLPFHGTVISPPFSAVGLVLNFDCGIPAQGTLFIDVETADRNGASDVSHVSARVGS